MRLVECVPNISEGRDQRIVQQLVLVLLTAPGVNLLDWSADPDHNRSVFTYVGEPESVLAATKALCTKAFKLIDMQKHKGAHPRLGAVDVVPFVPLRGVSSEEAVALARQLGEWIGEQGVPVYYYQDAATKPERELLPDVRRGEYEGLACRVETPEGAPDAGPAVFNAQSGASIVGVRFPLIAFNVNLATNDLSIAKRIAEAVRFSSGGYRHVRAMGVALKDKGQVQVSCDITQYEKTPIHRLLETIRSEAAGQGVAVAGCELIGLAPMAAFEDVVRHYLQLPDFSVKQVIESRLLEGLNEEGAPGVATARETPLIGLPEELPPPVIFTPGIRRAPDRGCTLSPRQTALAVKNALRYIPAALHEALAPEFLAELRERGRIYGYRFRPRPGAGADAEGNIKARPIGEYRGILEARALQLNIDNNLDFEVALYPYELVTYGETGQVFQNWMQYRLVKQYLEQMTETQTLVVASGHPVGLFPTHRDAPRVINTNGLMVGEFDNAADFHEAAQLGVANYGQMTAGGWMYIGPQGIVHGTYLTLLNAGRLYLGVPDDKNLAGYLYLSSGLGGMSGAQPRAAEIAGAVSIVAEVDLSRIETRRQQGWVQRVTSDLGQAFSWAAAARAARTPLSVAYHGNVVDLWQYAVDHELPVELASDQTSCHAAYDGGYVPQGLDFEAARGLLAADPAEYRRRVDESLRTQIELIGVMVARGTHFWDYGNSFLKAVFEAGVHEVAANGADTKEGFIYPSYVEHIMGPLCFDRGYGPFRWVCCSLDPADLAATDAAAMGCIDPERCWQDRDNFNWVRDAGRNKLVVGSQARILYSDAEGRVRIALAFNDLVRRGEIGPVIIGRDHHDVSGTDSPYRETSNIHDGSNVMADMAFHCWAGNVARGMTLVVASNGGGVGIGRAINTGFGLVLDGSERVDAVIRSAVEWDVMGGVARRAWARNEAALETAAAWNAAHAGGVREGIHDATQPGHITLPYLVDEELLEGIAHGE